MNALRGRALLFCPADRPDRYAKALAAADVVVLDLEDAVAPAAKAAARVAVLGSDLDPARVVVRVNPPGSPEHDGDVSALRATGYRTLMLPKCETAPEIDGFAVVALCETPLGILNAAAIAAAPGVVALMWGAEDLVAAMGGRSSRNPTGGYRGYAVHARATVLLAAKAHGRQAIDSVYLDHADLDGLAAEAEDAAAVGFDLKACIHPSQALVVQAAYRPSSEQVERARRILEAAAGGGVTSLDGVMIDAPLVRQAEQTLRDAHDQRGSRYGEPGETERSS